MTPDSDLISQPKASSCVNFVQFKKNNQNYKNYKTQKQLFSFKKLLAFRHMNVKITKNCK